MQSLSTFLNSGTTIITVLASLELPVRKLWSTSGQVAATFSTASGETYSPCCSLNMDLMRSTIFNLPYWSIDPTSPLRNQPSSKLSAFASGLLSYLAIKQPPLKQISPFHTRMPSTMLVSTLSEV